MKKQIRDLTPEDKEKICKKHTYKIGDREVCNIFCPFNVDENFCYKSFDEQEVEIDESDND